MSDDNQPGFDPATGEPADESAAATAEQLAQAQQLLAEMKDRLLRTLADQENIRKRAQREREDAGKYAASAFAKDMLNVADNLRRALESAPDESQWDAASRNLLTGVARKLPVLIVSGASPGDIPLMELWRKKWCFLAKPVRAPLLLKTIDHLCGLMPIHVVDADILASQATPYER